MRKVGKDIDSAKRWEGIADSYAGGIDGGYHRHRLQAIESLLPDLREKLVVDFGCGEGVLSEIVRKRGARHVVGIDKEQSLLDRARTRLPDAEWLNGGVETLERLARADVVIAANVLAYLTDEEERSFYQKVSHLGAQLVVTHSNQLFDLLTFNAYTVATCKEWFGFDASPLLAHPGKPDRGSFNIRENPLAFPDKLAHYGYQVERTAFMNLHPAPPLLMAADPDDMQRERPGTLDVAPEDRWKLMFQCSMFGVLASRTRGSR